MTPSTHRPIVLIHLLVLLLWGASGTAQRETFTITPVGSTQLLDAGWDLEYGPDDWLWITERRLGQVIRIHPETEARDELLRIPDLFTGASQDGLLGMALHPGLPEETPYVYLSYTYQSFGERRQRLQRYTYAVSDDGTDGTLSEPMTILEGLPASNDHNSGRLIFGPDQKLYYTIGDQGGNQNANYCNPILSQVLPSAAEVAAGDWRHYPGKTLRLNLDGSIPEDNPVLAGVRSHVFTYGHRNAQGIAFGPDGQLYSSEHGPDTDDEVNLLSGGGNYGWPRVVGFRDDQAYDYCNWSSLDNCAQVDYDGDNCPAGATFLEESTLTDSNYVEPLFALFAVPDDYDFNNPACENSWVCRPNVAPSSIVYYGSDALPGWTNSLLVVSLKRGRIYQLRLNEAGTAVVGDTIEHFYSRNRLRDLVVAPNGTDFYAITDDRARVTDQSGLNQFRTFTYPGNILKFSFAGIVSTSEPASAPAFRVWPNPVSQQLHLEGPTAAVAPATVTLFGPDQRPLRTHQHPGGRLTVSTAGLPAGPYYLRIQTAGGVEVHRVVVAR